MPTDEEIKRITELHDKGYSQGQIAKELNRSKSYINGIFQKLGLAVGVRERSQTKNATEANQSYTLEKRLALNDKFFLRLEGFVGQQITARDFKELMVAYGILEDKRQLLEPIKPDVANGKAAIVAYFESEKAKHEASRVEPQAARFLG